MTQRKPNVHRTSPETSFFFCVQAFETETEAQVAVKVRTVIMCALRGVYVKDHKRII